ncbi:RNA polymerase I specific transcription initiation factor [Diaporthe helianthi]|uniref:RNA polymerase I specific transcription initiation factor n=1 Tax=Diaporthe helianthi TaxID=158607 RepID=A0A2P5I8S0_DIAHE|nr:RNA polymerase I specific transcription initiation factor [Diaporthe helianthi]
MASSHEDEDWDKSTSEIQSEDSDDLHENRPNRWKGPTRSWLSITEEDRLTYNALLRVRNRDLSLHLYDAYKLKQGAAAVAAGEGSGQEENVDAETGEPVHNEPWAPPKSWTAWPLPAHLVPPDGFMPRTEDEDEVFTFRRPEDQRPSARLEEIISATILRFAKERLQRRGFTESAQKSDGGNVIKTEPLSSEAESQPGESEDDDEDDEVADGGEPSAGRPQRKQKAPVKTFKPVVSTDDDLSYDLIRPSTRRILDKLDSTLTILHNARMTSAQNLEDSEESSFENDNEYDDQGTPQRTSQSQQPSQPVSSPQRSPSKPPRTPAGIGRPPKKKSNRGRPRKYVQMQSESNKEYEIRRARALKSKVWIPTTNSSDVEDYGEDRQATAGAGGIQKRSPRKRRREENKTDDQHDKDKDFWIQKKLDRFRLRDWSDVLGAAALAGFPPGVVARATQRCADLFGQGMEMHMIDGRAGGVKTTTYQPGGEMPPDSLEAEGDGGGLEHRRVQSVSRKSSAPLSRTASSTSDEDDGDEGGASPNKTPQKRTKSKGKRGQNFCPFPDCERATDGFDRLFNLKRHLKRVHGEDSPPEASEEGEAAAVVDDMLDGIRRDGFLEPIRVHKGWRAEDAKKRAARTL